MATLIGGGKSALDVHLNGTIGTFRVSSDDGKSAGVEVRYLLTHVTLSEKAGQAQLLSMLAPVREVFDLKQLGFDEIMQRDIDDARVSLELIPYLLDTSTSGLIKLFPPIVAVALPLKPNSRVPDTNYRKVERTEVDSPEHASIKDHRITAGAVGEEQFEFFQHFRNGAPLPEGAQMRLARDNCTLAIVDGQHRAMALLALYRNLTGGWSDARRSPYEGYYKVWPEKEIRSYNLNELQLPVLICAFPQLDGTMAQDIDVVRAARRVFLTLNKTAKKVSDSRNKLLNDQDIVAECLRTTLSYIKALDVKDDTGLRIWNVELDQEGDRVKIVSDAAFSGVSHLYHLTEQLLMSGHARGIEARAKVGAPRKRLDEAYERLGLKDDLTSDQRSVNTRTNYSDEIADIFKKRWEALYVPIIDRVFGKLHPYAAFARATINLRQELVERRDAELEKMLFDGQATSRTFDDFREGLNRRFQDKEPNWTTPEIKETLSRVNGLMASRKSTVETMKAHRAQFLLDSMSGAAKKQVIAEGVVARPVRDAIDRMFGDVFSTVAFQTAVVCTYAEAIQIAFGGVQHSTAELLDEYIEAINGLLRPKNINDLKALMHTFEGELVVDPEVKLTPGGPTFRHVVLPGELQPAEWPKFRYLLLELWKPAAAELKAVVDGDRTRARSAVAHSLYRRRLAAYCQDNRVDEASLTAEVKAEILAKAKAMYEEFLTAIAGKKVPLDKSLFELSSPSTDSSAVDAAEEDTSADE
ncbi:DNA sulfur modification protein DndB [Paucibacter sp. XJ19-41]|uniref:DNA sulfur modification protein DndB n=1 Tax=Paucibacter sp. XJ19-41 TaxID=2927824 RepID=UPI00234921FE|nr:DNA sulfur modification protein DndB [Paucibacter sp. XJ19-41]MDC6168389.1 DNA sulfur modification protein DndB [Paucibacter sp. XJ19-41]